MTLLAVDIRSQSTALGLLDAEAILGTWRLASDPARTADEWRVYVDAMLGPSRSGVQGVVVSSTSPTVLNCWRTVLRESFAEIPQVIVEAGMRTGVSVQTDNPREVGADRICNAAALSDAGIWPAVAIDFNTATTFDVIDDSGRYVGGAITPGIEISLEALARHGAQLRAVEIVRPKQVIAKNTVAALQSGSVFGFASQVDGLIEKISDELGVSSSQVRTVATGPLAPLVVGECARVAEHDPHLTLRGMALIYARNT